jgi:hypothetical protein
MAEEAEATAYGVGQWKASVDRWIGVSNPVVRQRGMSAFIPPIKET